MLEKVRLGLLAFSVALAIVAPLMPSEAVAGFGANAPLTMSWLVLLLAWAAVAVFDPKQTWKADWSDAWLWGVVAWHTLAGWVAVSSGAPRAALNVLWLWIGYATSYWLLRQWLRSEIEKRALLAAMLALGVVLAGHGFYQYLYSGPQTRAEYQQDPESVLRRAGVQVVPGSPEAEQFRNRIESKEPLASFGLTNSLAGYLAPWLVIAIGIGLSLLRQGRLHSSSGMAVICAAVMLGICLFLTKSRTGILATGAGTLLVFIFAGPLKLRFSWRSIAIGATCAMGLALVAVLSQGWDRFVLTEAPKSLKYRLEYWQATAAMIAEHPWLGVGPGNFQDWYSRYKLPQASETIADPHNYWLELTATAGIPALLLFVGWHGALLLHMVRRSTRDGSASTSDAAITTETPGEAASRFTIYAGFGLGLFLVLPFDLLVSFVPEAAEPLGGLPVAWVIGGPCAALVLLGLDGWVVRGKLEPGWPGIGLLTLAINLLAAGSLIFPGVMTTAWVLAAIATSDARRQSVARLKPLAWAALAGASLVAILAHQTLYQPILASQSRQYEFMEARSRGEIARARTALQQWIAADPWSPEPWRSLAELELEQWLATSEAEAPATFLTAVAQTALLSPHSSRQSDQEAQWYWAAWRRGKPAEYRRRAVEAWQEAVDRYPNSSYLRAQYAWALAESGQAADAKREAEEALALDALNPHREQKLANRRLFDPALKAESPYRNESAEESLRSIPRAERSAPAPLD